MEENLIFDLKAGFITAVVALPLAIAFAIASGVPPIMGLYTAIISGILGSSFGGSKFSITGPTGAMTIIILSTVQKYGIEGLLITGFFAGILQILFGLLKFGKTVKYIPLPIVSGFTAGIGVMIFIGQIKNALGINIPAKEYIWETIHEIIIGLKDTSMIALSITIGTIIMLYLLPKISKNILILRSIPSSIIALIVFSFLCFYLGLNIPQIGDIPTKLPNLSLNFLFQINIEMIKNILPSALTIALLGSIEALLCAVVCDAMSNTKHNSDKELISQGIANFIVPFFNAIPSTAAIARSAVNIREGAKTKIAGIIHALILLIILLSSKYIPIMKYVPLSFLAGVLMFVSIKMINVHEFKTIMKISRLDTLVLFTTFALTVFTDLVFAVEIGMILAITLLFIRLTNQIDISRMEDYDPKASINSTINSKKELKKNVSIYTINGPFFFGAVNIFDKKINEFINLEKNILIIRMRYVPFIDSTGVVRFHTFLKDSIKKNKTILLTGLNKEVKEKIENNSDIFELIPKEHIFERTIDAISYAEKKLLPLQKKTKKRKWLSNR